MFMLQQISFVQRDGRARTTTKTAASFPAAKLRRLSCPEGRRPWRRRDDPHRSVLDQAVPGEPTALFLLRRQDPDRVLDRGRLQHNLRVIHLMEGPVLVQVS